jgi:hypothetical protein
MRKLPAATTRSEAQPAPSRRDFLRRCAVAGSLLPAGLLAGCNTWGGMRSGAPVAPTPQNAMAVPTSAQLVNYLNDNARRLQSLEVSDLAIDASQRLQSIGLAGMMACHKPKDFRMVARVGGQTQVDLGSNQNEFWYWVAKAEPPYLVHCSHQDFESGRARTPFPFQPEWIMEALGMGEYDPNRNYQVVTTPNTFELVESTTSPQGQPVRKITEFSRGQSHVQVTRHRLTDAQGKDICAATIRRVDQDPRSGAIFPRKIILSWPAEHIKLEMTLETVKVNALVVSERGGLFQRPEMPDVRSYNLALGIDPPGQGLRQTGGIR